MIYKYSEEDCPHLFIRKEILLGFKTGDYICTGCGLTSSSKEYLEYLRNKKRED